MFEDNLCAQFQHSVPTIKSETLHSPTGECQCLRHAHAHTHAHARTHALHARTARTRTHARTFMVASSACKTSEGPNMWTCKPWRVSFSNLSVLRPGNFQSMLVSIQSEQ
eukprot:621902-Amphidinium_carterae.1